MKYKKSLIYNFFFFLICLFFFSACSFKNREALLKTSYDADTIKTVFVLNPQEDTRNYYNIIKSEDELAISNLQDMDLIVKKLEGGTASNGKIYSSFKVNADGEISLPKIGVLKVAGLTRIQAASVIQRSYEEKELSAPIIDVKIINAYVILLGEVAKQGKYIIDREDYELIDLLGDAGGVTPNADKKLLKIFRGDRSNPEVILVNLQDYNFLKNPKLKLRSRDIVYVEPKRMATTSQNLQAYSTFVQIGLFLINTVLIIYNLSK